MRKLSKKRHREKPLASKARDVVQEYSTFGSRIYAPIMREGRHVEPNERDTSRELGLQQSSEQLDALDKRIPGMRPVRVPKVVTGTSRRDAVWKTHLEHMCAVFKDRSEQQGEEGQAGAVNKSPSHPGQSASKPQEKRVRAETPRTAQPREGWEVAQAETFLQSLVQVRPPPSPVHGLTHHCHPRGEPYKPHCMQALTGT